MGNNYQSIKRLIDLWETYEEETSQQELLGFADWLNNKIKQNPELNIKQTKRRVINEEPDNILIINNLDEPTRFLEYISRISKLHDFYIKKFFTDISINNRLEFFFLYTVNEKKRAKKTELINTHLVDYTTGMDTIKRLVNNGLLDETNDETDKRAKQLIITDEGKRVLEIALKKVNDEVHMFLACISMNKWKKTLSVFEEINNFHSKIYQTHNDKNSAELLNLMDSLKHLHK